MKQNLTAKQLNKNLNFEKNWRVKNIMKKNIFKDSLGNVHFGLNAPAEFQTGTKEDVIIALNNLGDKKLWRCTVCNDLSIGSKPPKECPTCRVVNVYIEIEVSEFNKLFELLI